VDYPDGIKIEGRITSGQQDCRIAWAVRLASYLRLITKRGCAGKGRRRGGRISLPGGKQKNAPCLLSRKTENTKARNPAVEERSKASMRKIRKKGVHGGKKEAHWGVEGKGTTFIGGKFGCKGASQERKNKSGYNTREKQAALERES